MSDGDATVAAVMAAFECADAARAIVRRGGDTTRLEAANAAWRTLVVADEGTTLPAPLRRAVPDDALFGVIDALVAGRPVQTTVVECTDGRVREVTVERCGEVSVVALATMGEYDDDAWLREVVDNSNHPMYVKDLDGRYLFVNRRWYTNYSHMHRGGVGPVGLTDAQIFPPDIAGPVRANDLRVMELGRPHEFEERAPTNDGMRWFVSLKFPLRDAGGHHFATAGISTDITHRKEVEAALIDARAETEHAYAQKSAFLSRMSHELRTPLNALLGFAQILHGNETLDDECRHAIARMLTAGEHLHALINEVLDLSAVESGRGGLELQPVDAAAAVREAAELMRPLAAQRGLSLSVDLHGAMFRHVAADPRRLRQVLLNLIGNAVKYSPADGRIRVETVHDAGSGRMRVVVCDDGPGIATEDHERAFAPFDRLGAEASSTEGSGLGLPVARGLAQAMGGDLGIMPSSGDDGCRAYVALALADGPDAVAQTLFPTTPRGAPATPLPPGTRLVYIEDHPDNVAVMRGIIDRAGEDVALLCAEDARSGLELVRAHRPDAILLDINLPDLPGEHLLRMLAGDPALAGIPVVVVSADANPERIHRTIAAGAAAYLTKPLAMDEVRTALNDVLAAS